MVHNNTFHFEKDGDEIQFIKDEVLTMCQVGWIWGWGWGISETQHHGLLEFTSEGEANFRQCSPVG